MRYYLLLCLLALAIGSRAQSTDVILHTDGNETPARVLAVSPQRITYLAGPDTLNLPTAEVFLIRYANGTREVLTTPAPPDVVSASPQAAKAQDRQGRLDAGRYFKTRGTFWGSYALTLASTPTFFLGGLVGSLALGCTKPQERNFTAPMPENFAAHSYAAGYRSRAAKKKFGSAALGCGLGIATVGVASLMILNGQ